MDVFKITKDGKYMIFDPNAPVAAFRDFTGKEIVYVGNINNPESLDTLAEIFKVKPKHGK